MENYSQFIERISEFEKPVLEFGSDGFWLNPNVKRKLNENNMFRPFYGDTTVFDLSDYVKSVLNSMVDYLYENAGECFAQRIKTSSLHITLHDLSNSRNLAKIGEEMFRNELTLLKFVHSKKLQAYTIEFETNYIINMVGTSLVLTVKPVSKADYDKLMNLYSIVDCAKTLPYPLTPHITLAYFNVNGFGAESSERLCNAVNYLNKKNSFEITVSTDLLYYEKFTDMNSYHRIFSFT